MDPSPKSGGDPRSGSPIEVSSRACDYCRTRKIRCDKRIPCSNCRNAQRPCVSPEQKGKEQRHRVLITTQYERKIDGISDRLSAVEQLLRTLIDGRQSVSQSSPASTLETPQSPDDAEEGFEGHSSLAAQTMFADEFATKLTIHPNWDPNLTEALLSLHQVVKKQNQQPNVGFAHRRVLPKLGLAGLTMPPQPLVISILRELKGESQAYPYFNDILWLHSVDNFINYCREVYFCTNDYSEAVFIIVNAILYYLFFDRETRSTNTEEADRYRGYRDQCRDNLETALSYLNILLPVRLEYLHALTLGVMFAIDLGRPSLAWQLNCTAARLCTEMGIHREPPDTESPQSRESKASLFWLTYSHDRSLALRLGRAPVIKETDITLSHDVPIINGAAISGDMIRQWANLARIQGRVFDELYSGQALKRPGLERLASAQRLAEDLKLVGIMNENPNNLVSAHATEAGMCASEIECIMLSEKITILSTLTLVYRAIPSPSSAFSPECIETARTAIHVHNQFMRQEWLNETWKLSHMYWSILHTPFIPFIVLFCHIIETAEAAEASDLQFLGEFVTSIETLVHISEPIQKLHRLGQLLHKVAALYVEAKLQQPEDQAMAIAGNDFDAYLTSIGLMPSEDSSSAWFPGNTDLMDLLEQEWTGSRD
ncbi:hypothetical protein F5Y04DRAFT_147304 [Hypomontagnella monticulosa]|nr:hypothetical protein F5Y04DRAFT_147304 [Hypomontagnella monticulosa]